MKKSIGAAIVLIIGSFTVSSFAGSTGSKFDFSAEGWTNFELCNGNVNGPAADFSRALYHVGESVDVRPDNVEKPVRSVELNIHTDAGQMKWPIKNSAKQEIVRFVNDAATKITVSDSSKYPTPTGAELEKRIRDNGATLTPSGPFCFYLRPIDDEDTAKLAAQDKVVHMVETLRGQTFKVAPGGLLVDESVTATK